MLFGKDFGGRHQGYLCTGANSLQRRQCRDNGLARANIALNKPEHRQWLAQVLTDIGQHMALRTGECKGQGIQETLGQIPRGQERERFTLASGGPVGGSADTRAAAWADADGDGDLDLFVGASAGGVWGACVRPPRQRARLACWQATTSAPTSCG